MQIPIGVEETGPKLPDHCQRSIAGHESVESDVSQLICARKRGENCWPRVGNISSLPSSGRFRTAAMRLVLCYRLEELLAVGHAKAGYVVEAGSAVQRVRMDRSVIAPHHQIGRVLRVRPHTGVGGEFAARLLNST